MQYQGEILSNKAGHKGTNSQLLLDLIGLPFILRKLSLSPYTAGTSRSKSLSSLGTAKGLQQHRFLKRKAPTHRHRKQTYGHRRGDGQRDGQTNTAIYEIT